ncbi:unnamed protein product [Ascophyllum nodosum]
MTNQPISVVDNKFFRDMVRTLKGKASIPQRRVLIARMEELLVDLQGSVATMLTGQYVSMTTDGWTSRANESYISFTVVYVNDDWKMVTLALSCSKKQAGIIPLRVIQDVETRWWSTQSMVERLVYLRRAVELHESLDNVAPLLGPVDWNVLELLEPVLAPFMYVQKKLESNNVTGSLVVPLICDLRTGLDSERKALQQPNPGASADVLAARVLLLPCVEALAKDFNNRFGDGSDILTFREGPRRQPQGFRKVQVMATALDPRCKMLYGVLPNEHEGVWQAVAMAAAGIAKSTQASVRTTALSAAGSTPAGPGPGASARPASKRFCGGFMAASQAQAASASTVTAAPSLPAEHFLNEAGREITRYRATSGLAMEEAQESGKILYPDPLDWWRINAVKFPLLAALARRL